jgi:hypothetical protein
MKIIKNTNKVLFYILLLSAAIININTFSFFADFEHLDFLPKMNNEEIEKIKTIAIKKDPSLKQEINNLTSGKDLANILKMYFIKKQLANNSSHQEEYKSECELEKIVIEKWKEIEKLNIFIKINPNDQNIEIKKNIINILNNYIAYQIINKEIRFKGSVILAELEFDNGNYRQAKKLIDYCLYFYNEKYRHPYSLAEAYVINANIYKKLINLLDNSNKLSLKEKNNLSKLNEKIIKKLEAKFNKKIDSKELYYIYIKKVASDLERASAYFEICTNKSKKLKINNDEVLLYDKKMLNTTLEAASNILDYTFNASNISDKKIKKYVNTSKNMLNKIINHKLPTQEICSSIILNKVVAGIFLANLYINLSLLKNKTKLTKKFSDYIKNETKNSDNLILDITKKSSDLMQDNKKLLEEEYDKKMIVFTQEAINKLKLIASTI